ncbi:MAG TPA: glycosyltransferase family 4 protein [Vicinamibacteria bacterium]|nr:glycosyltransferase family 4 protein [Vicinamibacteria bacterium]
MRVLAPLRHPTGRVPGQRYRIEQWAPLLRQEGIEVIYSPFLTQRAMDLLYQPGHLAAKTVATLRGYGRRLTEILLPGLPDVVFVHREAAFLGPAWLERMFAWRRPLVFDFDDAIYLLDTSPANAWAQVLKSPGKAAAICRVAHSVTVGNETLAGFARQHAKRVTVIPSSIDTEVYRPQARPPNPRPVLGWTGSLTTLRYLEGLLPALRRLRQRCDFELRVIGGEIRADGLDVTCLPWCARTEVADLAPLDVGLMPLDDDPWSRGKCGMKALQYMGLAIPPVVSPVGVNASFIRHGENGFLAVSAEDWIARLTELLRDAALRERLGRAARQTVEEEFSARVQAPRLAQVLRDAATS